MGWGWGERGGFWGRSAPGGGGWLGRVGIDVVSVADRALGNALEGITNAHHARRLGRLGRGAQRTPPDDGQLWAAGDPPPRAANAVDVLIDGVAYFSALEQ